MRCLRQSVVGQKCPRCARNPRGTRALGKPVHYAKAVGGGLAVAVGGGVALWFALAALPFGGIILPGLLGYGVGRTVAWGAAGQRQAPFPVIAVTLAVLGALVGIGGPLALRGPFSLLGIAAAGYFAYRGLHS
ncbi:MAG: hypothetical protein M3R09_02895 [Actinomycetota bacterium]|nr:hypothetical protein [Actinomycetota bacterium]